MHKFAMRKNERQNLIVELVRANRIATQSELRDALARKGVECDQGTVSRDAKELGLVKAAAENGNYYYAVLDDVSPTIRTTRASVLKQLVKAVVASGNLIVIKCGP